MKQRFLNPNARVRSSLCRRVKQGLGINVNTLNCLKWQLLRQKVGVETGKTGVETGEQLLSLVLRQCVLTAGKR